MDFVRQSIFLDSALLAAAHHPGLPNLSRLLNDALGTYLQALQARDVEELEAAFVAEYGPIPHEVITWADTLLWPE